jgi:hypothetical protein
MRFRTIWTIPAMTVLERLRRTRDWGAMTIAANLPLRVRFWVAILEIGHATAKSENVPATPLSDILEELRRPTHVS